MSTIQSGFNMAAPATLTGAVYTSAGGLSAGTYGYGMTYTTGFGETTLSTPLSVAGVGASGSVQLTAIPVGPDNVIKRTLYRTAVGGTTYFKLADLDARTTVTYVDVATDASLSATQAPTTNTASSRQTVQGQIGFSGTSTKSFSAALTARAGGGQTNATALPSEFNFIAVCATLNDSVILPATSSATIGQEINVRNNGATTAAIFPATGGTINGGAANASITLATGVSVSFIQTGAAAWLSF